MKIRLFGFGSAIVDQTLLDALDQAVGGVLDHVQNQIEAMAQTVVGIGNFVIIEVL